MRKNLCNVCGNVTEWDQTRHEESSAATCTKQAYCNICNSYFGKTKPHNCKTMTADDTKHSVICNDCSKTETAAHESDATCTTAGTCNTCKKSYKNPDNHAGLFTYVYTQSSDESFHTKTEICTGCEKPTGKIITEKHTETIKATCTTAAYCEVCKSNYGNPDTKAHALEHHDAKAATCLEKGWKAYDTCKRCDYTTYQELKALGHDKVKHAAKNPTCTDYGWYAYDTCTRCDYSTCLIRPALGHDKVKHDAKAATCLDIGWKAYDTCTRCDYTTYAELPALGHDYKERVHAVTCEKDGYTSHNCTRCGDRYVTDRVAKLNHWFGEWTPVEETTHEATCLREGCGFAANVDCETIEFALALDGQEPLTLSLCPVCGRMKGGESLLLENVTAEALKGSLPLGEAFARLFTLEGGEKVLLVGFEYGGKLAKADCPVKITLPTEALAGYSLSLIESDGTLTALEITVDGELATFELDFSDAESPIALIRLLPAA